MTTRSNFYVDQGVDFSVVLDLFNAENDFIITDQTFNCQVRKVYSSPVAFEPLVTINSGDENLNTLNFRIPASATVNVKPGKYQYDIIMRDDPINVKLLEGIITIIPTMTVV